MHYLPSTVGTINKNFRSSPDGVEDLSFNDKRTTISGTTVRTTTTKSTTQQTGGSSSGSGSGSGSGGGY